VTGEATIGDLHLGITAHLNLGDASSGVSLVAGVLSAQPSAGLGLGEATDRNPGASDGLFPGPGEGLLLGAYVDLALGSDSGVMVGAGIDLTSHGGVDVNLEGEVELFLAAKVEIDSGSAGLSLDGSANLDLGAGADPSTGGAGLHLAVDADLGLDEDDGLPPGVRVDLSVGGGADINLEDTSGAALQLTVDGGFGAGGAGLALSGSADGNGSRAFAAGFSFFPLSGFTRDRRGDQPDALVPGDSEQPEKGRLERELVFLLTDLFSVREGAASAEEPLGAAVFQVPPGVVAVQVIGVDAGEISPEETDLSPENAGLLGGGAPFDVSSLEQLLEQFLGWLDGIGDELVGLWAGLGIPPWVLLVLAAAVAAGEVARRNLRQLRRSLLDAAFAPAPLG
jgi:hypothetical protein